MHDSCAVIICGYFFVEQPLMVIPDAGVDKMTRRNWFLELCQQYVEKYLGYSDVSNLVEQTNQLQLLSKGPYPCRDEKCGSQFVYHSKRIRYYVY
jgi:hypothetical protein